MLHKYVKSRKTAFQHKLHFKLKNLPFFLFLKSFTRFSVFVFLFKFFSNTTFFFKGLIVDCGLMDENRSWFQGLLSGVQKIEKFTSTFVLGALHTKKFGKHWPCFTFIVLIKCWKLRLKWENRFSKCHFQQKNICDKVSHLFSITI